MSQTWRLAGGGRDGNALRLSDPHPNDAPSGVRKRIAFTRSTVRNATVLGCGSKSSGASAASRLGLSSRKDVPSSAGMQRPGESCVPTGTVLTLRRIAPAFLQRPILTRCATRDRRGRPASFLSAGIASVGSGRARLRARRAARLVTVRSTRPRIWLWHSGRELSVRAPARERELILREPERAAQIRTSELGQK